MAQCYRNSGSLKNGMAAQAHRTSGSFAPRLFSRFFYLKSLVEKDIVNASAQRQTVPRGTQAFRNFTERTNNNYMEKVMRQYRE